MMSRESLAKKLKPDRQGQEQKKQKIHLDNIDRRTSLSETQSITAHLMARSKETALALRNKTTVSTNADARLAPQKRTS